MFVTRKIIRQKFNNLIQDSSSRDQIADWANQLIIHDLLSSDPVINTAIFELSGADFLYDKDNYLYGTSDFKQWLKNFENAAMTEEQEASYTKKQFGQDLKKMLEDKTLSDTSILQWASNIYTHTKNLQRGLGPLIASVFIKNNHPVFKQTQKDLSLLTTMLIDGDL